MNKWIISCQVWEWYGDEDFKLGRYKPKGREDFVFEMPYEQLYDLGDDAIIELWNQKFNKEGDWFLYEARSINTYFEPSKAEFKDGTFTISYDPQ